MHDRDTQIRSQPGPVCQRNEAMGMRKIGSLANKSSPSQIPLLQPQQRSLDS